MLKLDVGPSETLSLKVGFPDARCPMAWEFVFFSGSPERAEPFVGVAFDFFAGQQGVEAYGGPEFPVQFNVSRMDYDGASKCPMGSITIRFPRLPVGIVYLLEYSAGTPFEGHAVLASERGVTRVVDESSGERTFYVNSSGFSPGQAHIAVHSPGFHTFPNTAGGEGLWHPCCYWPGDSVAGVDVGFNRSASLTFLHQPYYYFGALKGGLEVSNASVTDGEGRVTWNSNSALARVGQHAINSQGILTWGPTPSYPPGDYLFQIHHNADVGAGYGVPWHAYAVDYWFPETEGS